MDLGRSGLGSVGSQHPVSLREGTEREPAYQGCPSPLNLLIDSTGTRVKANGTPASTGALNAGYGARYPLGSMRKHFTFGLERSRQAMWAVLSCCLSFSIKSHLNRGWGPSRQKPLTTRANATRRLPPDRPCGDPAALERQTLEADEHRSHCLKQNGQDAAMSEPHRVATVV